MTASRKTIYLQWGLIALLLFLLWNRPTPECPEVKPASRTVYVTMHDTVWKTDTVKPQPTGIRKKLRVLTPPERPVAVVDCTVINVELDSCTEYYASKSDTSVDIYVMYCTPLPAQDVVISYRLKGVKSIQTIDSIPYKVGYERALLIGGFLTTYGGVGPAVGFQSRRAFYQYSYDVVNKSHSVGFMSPIWRR